MEKKTARIEAFSDGIFGVAITLLAIEIGIAAHDGTTNRGLWESILEKRGEYFAYFNSFATVLLIWMGHQRIFEKIWKASHRVILLNGLVLLFVVLFPFPTRTAGTFLNTPAVNTAVAFYAGFTGLIVLTMLLLNLGILADTKNLIDPGKQIAWFRKQVKQQLAAILIYTIAAVLAFYYPAVSLVLTFLMWVYWAIVTKEGESE